MIFFSYFSVKKNLKIAVQLKMTFLEMVVDGFSYFIDFQLFYFLSRIIIEMWCLLLLYLSICRTIIKTMLLSV